MSEQPAAAFPDTQWSQVVRTALGPESGSREALSGLYRSYWYPLYGFARGKGLQAADAEDVVQDFFVYMNGQNLWAEADPLRGRLRTFLLVCFQRFMTKDFRRSQAAKRGGGAVHVDLNVEGVEERYAAELTDPHASLECFYHRRWATLVLDSAMQRLREDRAAANKTREFEVLQQFLSIHLPTTDSYLDAARKLGISENTVTVTVFRLRRRYREMARKVIADTLDNPTPEQIEEEWQALIDILGKPGF